MTFTEENKKSIDISVTVLIMAVVAWYLWKRKTDPKFLAAYTVGAGLLAYVLMSQITNTLIDVANKPDLVDGAVDPSVDPNWDPKPITDSLHDELNPSWLDSFQGNHNLDAYQNALNLGNEGLIAVYNDWLARYWAEDDETLTAALSTYTIYWGLGNGGDAITLRDQLISRLNYLQLY